jgi:predicted transcriptional regulator
MTLELDLSPELQARLSQEAERRGESAETVALRLLEEHLPPPLDERRAAAIAMLHQWMKEDAELTDEESQEAEEFLRSLDASRTSNRPLFPPELKGITW